ncbi:MAG TPA: DUF5700 domain-containing putative Zn-dependent protease [Chitinophagaceae bacterium]|jgi:hypothetical protein|nr:DUF5700 domain-containing putative Zn-dependent protease [Chitinophagaceae bacterium]
MPERNYKSIKYSIVRKLIVVIFLLSFSSAIYSQSKLIDLTAMEHVWKIIGKLEKEVKPSEDEWKALFETPGYKALGDWNNDNIRKNFELVYLPSRKAELDTVLRTAHYWLKRDLSHLIQVQQQQEEIKKYQVQLNVDKIIDEALQRAEVYLPKGITNKQPPPPIRFVVFSPDARANNGNIIYDIQLSRKQGENQFINVIAHEVHHHYSFLIEETLFNFPAGASSYEPILSAISLLRGEGIADLIDKTYPPVIVNNDTAGYNLKISAQRLQTPKMKQLDSILCKMSDDTTGMYEMGKKAMGLFPSNGHYNGQYMAVLIKKHLGTAPLIEASSNPFLFFCLYRQACQKEKTEYILSDKAMAFINRMENIFAKKSGKKNK